MTKRKFEYLENWLHKKEYKSRKMSVSWLEVLEDAEVYFLKLFFVFVSFQMEPLYTLALISLILNLILMIFKISVYYYLNSNSMLIEGVNSLISSIFAMTTMVSIRYSESMQYLDEIVSLLFGLFFIIYGTFNVVITFNKTVHRTRKYSEYQLIV